jgi:hypothetical protein
MANKVSVENIKMANRVGLDGVFTSYYTPVLMVAYNLGSMGISLQDAPVVTGYRYGKAPESYISYNAAAGTAEHGLSLAALENGEEVASVIWFWGREKYTYTGVLADTGSDGEPVILSTEAENFDNY